MNNSHLMCTVFTIILFFSSVSILAQQPYFGIGTTDCSTKDISNSAFGYFCNGVKRSCQSYLTFRSQPPFTNVTSISALLGADPLKLSKLNSISQNANFHTNQMVLVPVTCSCSGQFYQSNTFYDIKSGDTFLLIAMITLQGLSTCHAINAQNKEEATKLVVGTRINVPLRCACPTKNQIHDGVKYLLSYLVASGEYVSLISKKIGVDSRATLAANGLSENAPIFPNTTLLVPLLNPPSSSPSPTPPPSPPSTPVYAVAVVVGGLVALSLLGVVIFFLFFRIREKKADPQFVSESSEEVENPLNMKVEELEESSYIIAQSVWVYTLGVIQAAKEKLIKGSVYQGMINEDFARSLIPRSAY